MNTSKKGRATGSNFRNKDLQQRIPLKQAKFAASRLKTTFYGNYEYCTSIAIRKRYLDPSLPLTTYKKKTVRHFYTDLKSNEYLKKQSLQL